MDNRFIARRAISADNVAVSELNQRVFRETFIDTSMVRADEHDLQSYFHTSVSPQTFTNKLTDQQQATWVIEDKTNDELVAFANVGPCCLPHPNVDTSKDGEIYRIYVRRDYQGYGLGQWLMKLALSWLEKQFRQRPVWLLVHVNNLKAQNFYKHYNFHRFADLDYNIGEYKAPNCIMRRENSSP